MFIHTYLILSVFKEVGVEDIIWNGAVKKNDTNSLNLTFVKYSGC